MSHECHDTHARGGKSTHAIPSHRSMGSWGLSQSMDRILNLNSEGARSWSRLGLNRTYMEVQKGVQEKRRTPKLSLNVN